MLNFINRKEKKAKSIYYVISKRRISGTDDLNKFSKGSYKGPITNSELDVADISKDVCRDLSELLPCGSRLGLLEEIEHLDTF